MDPKSTNTKLDSFHDISGSVWLLTFSDLLTLLLTLFVMRYAMSAIDNQRWLGLAASVRSAVHGPAMIDETKSKHDTLVKLEQLLRGIEQASSEGVTAVLQRRGNKAVIELSGSVFFGSTDELTVSGKHRLLELARALVGLPVLIDISAHAQLTARDESPFASPWDLSSAWAAATVRQFIDAGVSRSVISAAGIADIQQDEDEESKKPARRLEITITPQ